MEFKISLLCQRLQLVVQYLATAAVLLLFYGTPTAPAQTAAQIAETKASTVSLEMTIVWTVSARFVPCFQGCSIFLRVLSSGRTRRKSAR